MGPPCPDLGTQAGPRDSNHSLHLLSLLFSIRLRLGQAFPQVSLAQIPTGIITPATRGYFPSKSLREAQ